MKNRGKKKAVLQHIALSVSNLERSIEFYCQMFGFRIVLEMNFSDEVIGCIIGYPGAKCQMVQMEKDGRMLELFQYSNPKGRPIPLEKTQADIGLSHLCFVVDNIEAVKKELLEGGKGLLGDKVEVRPNVFIQYCFGPDREIIELKEVKNRKREG